MAGAAVEAAWTFAEGAVLKPYPAAPAGGNRAAQLTSGLDTALRSR